MPTHDECDHIKALTDRFASVRSLLILGRGPSAHDPGICPANHDAVLVTDPTYATADVYDGDPFAVLIGDRSEMLPEVAKRYNAAEPRKRPLLMYAYLPCAMENYPVDFAALGLPPPLAVLPLLEHTDLYRYDAAQPYPTSGVFLVMLAAALAKPAFVTGIDLYRHPSGRMYVDRQLEIGHFVWPSQHSEAIDVKHLRRAADRLGDRLTCIGVFAELLGAN